MAPLTTTRSTQPLPSHLQMPHVFVTPPEEEQQDNPPWCCFDADDTPDNDDFLSNPDIHFPDPPYLSQPSENDPPVPISRRTSTLRPRHRATLSRKLEKTQRPEPIKIIETKSSHPRQKDAREDSDIIEVVKVKRSRDALADMEENTRTKRSRTLKARATSALQSIKSVRGGSHRTHVKELWTSSQSTPGIFKGVQEQIRSQQDPTGHRPSTLPKKGSLLRSNSRSLSQIFQPIRPSRSESESTARIETSVAITSAHRAQSTVDPSSLKEIPGTIIPGDKSNKPLPLSSSLRKNVNTRFSVRDLHRLFTFSSSSPDDPPSEPTPVTVPFLSTHSSPIPLTSTPALPSDYAGIPMEQDGHADALLVLENAEQNLTSQHRDRALHTDRENDCFTSRRLSDLSFEIIETRLGSLHFDALSFDPQDFDVSMEGDFLR